MKSCTRFLTIIALVAAVHASLAAFAGPLDDFTYTSDGTAITITEYTGAGGVVTVPATIDDLPVTHIVDLAFFNHESLTRVTIPDSVTIIEEYAFVSCPALGAIDVDVNNLSYSSTNGVLFTIDQTTLMRYPAGKTDSRYTIPDSVTSIGDSAFQGCYFLTAIDVADNNPSYSSTNGVLFTIDQTTLVQYPAGKPDTGYIVLDHVTTIGDGAFDSCINLVSVTLGNGVTLIGDSAFYSCDDLAEVSIGTNVTTIGEGAFSWCTALDNVTLPDSVTTIGDYAFDNCISLESIMLGSGVTEIGDFAFALCAALTSITIPDSVATIGESAFVECEALVSASIGNSVTEIGDYAFALCTALTSITFPASVTTIGAFAFASCDALASAFFYGPPPTTGADPFLNATATFYYLPAFADDWPATFADCPTQLWNPAFTEIFFIDGTLSCVVSAPATLPLALEATTNLLTGLWVRLCTTNLSDRTITLHDPDAANHPARFYRLVCP